MYIWYWDHRWFERRPREREREREREFEFGIMVYSSVLLMSRYVHSPEFSNWSIWKHFMKAKQTVFVSNNRHKPYHTLCIYYTSKYIDTHWKWSHFLCCGRFCLPRTKNPFLILLFELHTEQYCVQNQS